MFAQEATIKKLDGSPFNKSRAESNPPTAFKGYVTGTTATFNWNVPIYEELPCWTNGNPATTGYSRTGTGNSYQGYRIPAAALADFPNANIVGFGFCSAANGSAITAVCFTNGGVLTEYAVSGVPNNTNFLELTLSTPLPLAYTHDLYASVKCTGASSARTFARYDNQNTGTAGYTAIVSTTGTSGWTDCATSPYQTFCMYVIVEFPKVGTTYKLYSDGTAIQTGITGTTATVTGLTATAKQYWVTGIEPEDLTESVASNKVTLAASQLPAPTGLTGVYNPAPNYSASLSWNYTTNPSENVVLLDEKFTTDPFPRGWLSLQGTGVNADCKWAWQSTCNVPSPPCVSSASYTTVARVPNNWLVTPQITGLTGVTKLYWLVSPQDPNYPAEKYSVYVSTTGNQIADFTAAPLHTETCTASMAGGVVRSVDLSAYAGQSIYIAFRHYDCTDMFRINIDDIKVITNFNVLTYISGFYIYDNGAKVGAVAADVKTFTKAITQSGNHTFTVTAVSGDLTNESLPSNSWSTGVVSVPEGPCTPPYDFIATDPTITAVNLTWKDPLQSTFKKYWTPTENPPITSVSVTSYTFAMGIGFDVADMQSWGYGNMQLKAIRYYLVANSTRVGFSAYSGGSATAFPTAANSVFYQNVTATAYIQGAGWKEYPLATPINIDRSKPFFIAVQHPCAPAMAFDGNYTGPIIKNRFSNAIGYVSGTTTTAQIPLTTTLNALINSGGVPVEGNWVIQAVVGYIYAGKDGMPEEGDMLVSYDGKTGRIISTEYIELENVTEPIVEKLEATIEPVPYEETDNSTPDRAPEPRNLGFNIYRDNVKIVTHSQVYAYTDVPTLPGIYKYKISADYTDACGEVIGDPITVEFGNIQVKNLTATVNGRVITLNWSACDANLFIQYNIYLAGTQIATITNAATTTYAYLGENPGVYNFQVSATYNFAGNYETKKASASVTLSDQYAPVVNLAVQNITNVPTEGLLTWDVPTGARIPTTYSHGTGIEDVGWSLGYGTGTGIIRTGHLYTPAFLYNATYNRVKSISVYLVSDMVTVQGTAEVYLATGTGTANIITGSRIAFTPVLDAWNTIPIPNTVTVNTASNIYAGYILTNWNGYPCSIDIAPENANNGLVATSGTAALAAGGFGCWMIKVEFYNDATTPLTTVQGYNVVKNGDLATLTYTTSTEYSITDNNTAEYWVSAVHTAGSSNWMKKTAEFYPVTIVPATNGTVNGLTSGTAAVTGTNVLKNSPITVATTPNTGYHLNAVTVNTVPIAGNTFNVAAASAVSAIFDPNTYTVVYNGNTNTGGATASSSHTYNVAKTLTPNGFTKTGYSFAGWGTVAAGPVAYTNGQSVMNLTDVDNGTVNLYAIWTANTYTVTLNMQNGTGGTPSVTATFDAPMPTATAPTRIGYTFAGYYTEAAGAGTMYYTATMASAKNWDIPSNTTLYAKWNPNQYTLTLNPTPGTIGTTSIPVYYELPIGTIPEPNDRPGYEFTGWYTGMNCTGTKITATTTWTTVGDLTVYACWKAKTYTLTLNASTGTCNQASVQREFNGAILPLPNAMQSGCQFIGWFIDGVQVTNTYNTWIWTEDKEAIAKFNYPINVTVVGGTYGTVTPSNPQLYYSLGQNVTYNFNPVPGAHVASVVINGTTIVTGNPELTEDKSYDFTNIDKAYNVTVTFARNCYAPNITLAPGTKYTMTIPPSTAPVSCVPHGSTAVINFTSAGCSDITNINIAGLGDMGVIPSHTFPNVTAPLPAIIVEGNAQTFTITATNNDVLMGTISYLGAKTWSCGDDPTYYIDPMPGYRIVTVKVDGVNVPAAVTSGSYKFNDLDADHTIAVVFELIPVYLIQFGPQDATGKVYPDPVQFPGAMYYIQVPEGTASVKFFIDAEDGYEIDKVLVDGYNIPASVISGTYTFNNINKSHTITATFKPIMFTINATATNGGKITPSGAVQAPKYSTPTFTATADAGYHLVDVLVDGSPESNPYTFPSVVDNHTIHAIFAINTYKITPTAGPNGTISPNTVQTVNHGSNKTFNFTPATGYKVNQVIVDGTPIPGAADAGSYTFYNVTGDHNISVTFTKKLYTITSIAGANGSIEAEGVTNGVEFVPYWDHSAIYVFNPNPGYFVKQVLVDGENNPMAVFNGMHRFLNVSDNHSLVVFFGKDEFVITAMANQGGVINPAGFITVPNGANKTFYFSAEQGYELVRVIVDGINDEDAVASGFYTFLDVSENHTISAQFERITYTVTLPEGVEGVEIITTNGSSSPVNYNGSFTFEVNLLEGYKQSESDIVVRTNGVPLKLVGGGYKISNIAADQNVSVEGVKLNTYLITAKAETGGNISPKGTMAITHGDNMTFAITPNMNYVIDNVLVNGESEGPIDSYTFADVKANASIVATFKWNPLIVEENEANINVFSNRNVITIENQALIPVRLVEIMDMFGRVIWQGHTLGEKTDVTLNVATGIYNVRIITESNEMTTTKVSVTK